MEFTLLLTKISAIFLQVDEQLAYGVNVTVYNGQVSSEYIHV